MRLIFAEYASGKYSYRELARWLNTNGHLPPDGRRTNGRAHAAVWVPDGIKDLLRNERYVGRFRYKPRKNRGSEAIAGVYPALIDEATWEACVAIRRKNACARSIHSDRRFTRFALTGLLCCGRCGAPVGRRVGAAATRSLRTTRADVASASRATSRPRTATCSRPKVRAWLAAVRLPSGSEEAFAAAVPGNAQTPSRSKQDRRCDVERRLERLRDLYELGNLRREDHLARREELQAQLTQLAKADPVADPWRSTSASRRSWTTGIG